MSDFKNSGSCLCGEVKYEVSGKIVGFYLCHCQYCQKDTGSEHAANIFISDSGLEWLQGYNAIHCLQRGTLKVFVHNVARPYLTLIILMMSWLCRQAVLITK